MTQQPPTPWLDLRHAMAHGDGSYSIQASQLGLPPDAWPLGVRLQHPDGREELAMGAPADARRDDDGSVIAVRYRSASGTTLTVFGG